MSRRIHALAILIAFTVINLFDCMPANAAVEKTASSNKAYAVFVISYNDSAAIGGVAGTAFFVSPTKALTAYHVLQAVSFHPLAGYTHSRVWLVHEGEPAIELHETDVTYDQNNDLTAVAIHQSVKTDYIYSTAFETKLIDVETEGFRANSSGPRLERVGSEIEITAVPTLERIHLRGSIIQRTRVDLHAIDVTLNRTACVQVSYQPIRGMSGGPLIAGGKVIGVNSFADPGTKDRTWAIAVDPRSSPLFVSEKSGPSPL